MGCWNKSCALTGLPIGYNDRVVTFLITSTNAEYGHSHCHNNWAWNLVPMPLRGVYNDYGWMEFDDGEESKLKILQDMYGSRLVRLEEYKDGSYVRYPDLKDSPFESVKALGNSLHGTVFGLKPRWSLGKDRSPTILDLGIIMMREEAFLGMTDSMTLSDDRDEHFSRQYLIDMVEAYRSQNSVNLEELEDQLDALKNAEEPDEEAISDLKLKLMDARFSRRSPDLMKFLKGYREEKGVTVQYDHFSMDYSVLRFLFSDGGSETGYDTADSLAELRDILSSADLVAAAQLDKLFDQLRKSFYPQGGEGSQDGVTASHLKFAEVFQKSIDAIDYDRDDFCGGEENQEIIAGWDAEIAEHMAAIAEIRKKQRDLRNTF